MVRTTGFVATLGAFVVLLSCSVGHAGVLNGHGDAFGGWTGTVAFDNGSGLMGDLDYAVFTAAKFNANFAGLGYVPGDALVYTYQLFNSGTDSISAEIVGITNPANTIGTFDIGDVNAFSASFVGGNAQWLFNPAIAMGESSWGLAFSSPNVPMAGAALTINGGSSVLVTGIPTPSEVAIPEPASLVLFAGAAVMMMLRRRWF